MRRRPFFLLILLGVALIASPVAAVEIQTFFDSSCVPRSGLLLRVDDTQVSFIGLDGSPQAIARDDVAAIVSHRALENPLRRIALLGETRLLMRDVWIGSDKEPSFTGWTVGFFENLVVFLDVDGTTHVLEREDIGRIRPVRRAVPGETAPRVFAPAELSIPDGLVTCPTDGIRGSLRPTRVIGDRIKVGEHLAKMAELFRDVDGFEERTRVYARPFLYDRTMRLGLSYYRKGGNSLPLYFQWASGRPYRFQSLTAVGRIQNPSLPSTAPSLSVRSDLKSHFFHAFFAGHIPSLAAGSQAYIGSNLIQNTAGTTAVDELYNYLMAMGADFGPWSLSVGSIYRDFRLAFTKDHVHEVSAENASWVFRLGYMGSAFALRALYFRTRQSGQAGGNAAEDSGGDALRVLKLGETSTGPFTFLGNSLRQGLPLRYTLKVDTVRLGATVDLTSTLRVGMDEIIAVGKFSEGNAMGGIDMRYWQAFTSLFVSQAFGQYVSATGFLTLRRHDYTLPSAIPTKPYFDYDLGGALEFLF